MSDHDADDPQNGRRDRRNMLRRLAALAGWPALTLGTPARFAHAADRPATTVTAARGFMQRAADMRQQAIDGGDQPYGAVVVKGARIVGLGPSRVITRQDPTAHAEMEAIRDAATRLGTNDLSGCVMYSTSRPCPMCETAGYWAHIERLYYHAELVDGGPPRYPAC